MVVIISFPLPPPGDHPVPRGHTPLPQEQQQQRQQQPLPGVHRSPQGAPLALR